MKKFLEIFPCQSRGLTTNTELGEGEGVGGRGGGWQIQIGTFFGKRDIKESDVSSSC